ncbi:hypothetical protein, partial [Acidiphilium sp.]|uniref:hypothetical protein n=1 Tax=Acidiphilium sp. TaxID=527 RepID=UPI003D0908AB
MSDRVRRDILARITQEAGFPARQHVSKYWYHVDAAQNPMFARSERGLSDGTPAGCKRSPDKGFTKRSACLP